MFGSKKRTGRLENVVEEMGREDAYVTAQDTIKSTLDLVMAKAPSDMLEEPDIAAEE